MPTRIRDELRIETRPLLATVFASPPSLPPSLPPLPHIFVIFGSRMFMQRHKSNPNPHWMDINNSRATSKGQRAHKDACNCTTCASALAPRLCSPSRIENRRRLIPSPRNRTSSSCYAPSLHRERSLVEQKYPVTFFRSTDRHPPELGEIILGERANWFNPLFSIEQKVSPDFDSILLSPIFGSQSSPSPP